MALNFRLAWQAVAGRRLARVSLVVRIVGIAFATLVLLLAASADGALEERGDRISWRTDWSVPSVTPDEASLQVHWTTDRYYDHEIGRVQLVQLAPGAPVPPGLPRLPEPGESFVSPALARLIDADPAILAPRFGDTIAGTISRDGLSDPSELVAISGHAQGEIPPMGVFYRDELPTGFHQSGITILMRTVIIIGVVVLLFPIAMFIAAAARLNAQESDARLAALRLAGADPTTVRWIVAWESALAALPGILLGLGMFFAVRPLAAEVYFDDAAFYTSDFALNGLSALVLLLVPVIVVAASFIGLRGVEISPLGVSRGAAHSRVRPIGLLLLLPGFALLWYALDLQESGQPGAALVGLVAGILVILVAVAFVGTWLGQSVARIVAARARSGAALLAFRRIVADPRASFRTVSGVTFAVFAGTLFLSLSAALERDIELDPPSGLQRDAIWFNHNAEAVPEIEGLPEGTLVVPLASMGATTDAGGRLVVQQGDCDVFASVLSMEGGCGGRIALRRGAEVAPGDTVIVEVDPPVSVTIPADAHIFDASNIGGWVPDVLLPPGTFDWFEEAAYASTVVVAPPVGAGPGTRPFEQIRTALIRALPSGFVATGEEYDSRVTESLRTMRSLVYLGTFSVFALSGSTAAMAVASGIIARRRPFALLRMSGCSLGVLRRVVMTEATLPLVLVSTVSAATAVGVSALIISRVGEGSVLPPAEFALPLVAGLALGLALPLMTLPLLGAVTRLEQTRFE